ncbi:MAG: tetratricopeptide repeat protein [Terriglobales bacterium]
MDATTEQRKLWSAAQTYGLSIICLLLGIVCGYLLHSPADRPVKGPNASEQMAAAVATGQGHITQAQLKHMADKKAEPLLAQLQQSPNDAGLLAEIGKTYAVARQLDTATEYYERSVKIKPDPRVLTTLSTVYHFAGADDKAIETLNRALHVDPTYADAMFNLGMLQWQSKSDAKGAIATWQRLLKTHPNHPKRAQIEQVIARARKHLTITPGTKTDKPAL